MRLAHAAAAPAAAEPLVPRAALARLRLTRPAFLVLGAWTLVALVTTQQGYYVLSRTGRTVDWQELLAANLASCWLWAAFTPAIVWLTRRYPVSRATWRSTVPRHLAFALAFHLADALAELALPAVFGGRGAASPPLGIALVRHAFVNLSSYLVVVALASAADYARLYREREVAAARLAEQLSAARLHVLQSQLRPHFLFNTLNTIAEQIHTDPDGADHTIMRLSALLRASFAEGEEVPLRSELEVVGSYIDIMAVRFDGRMEVSFQVDREALDALVPRFLLQPLVENALRHGIEPLARGGRLEVVAIARGEVLELEVRDTGRGLPESGPGNGDATAQRVGVGLRNTRDRLRQLYGDAHRLTLSARQGGGVVAAVAIPLRRSNGGTPTAPAAAGAR